jgi:Cdc6-like AAA superfamily ATPase
MVYILDQIFGAKFFLHRTVKVEIKNRLRSFYSTPSLYEEYGEVYDMSNSDTCWSKNFSLFCIPI